MWINYLKTTLRNFRKYKFYSMINVVGLTAGIVSCLLIALFVLDELSYDTWYETSDRVYRFETAFKIGGRESHITQAGRPAGPTLKETFPEIEEYVRLRNSGMFLIRYEDKIFKEMPLYFVDGSFFKVFDFDVVSGNPETALVEPYSLMMSETLAEKYFGDEDPVGKTVNLDNDHDYTVTGVFKDIPENTHFDTDLLASYSTREDDWAYIWLNMNFQTYLLLKPNTDPKALESKFRSIVETHIGPELQHLMGASLADFESVGNYLRFNLRNVEDIHLTSGLSGELKPTTDMNYIYIFSAVAIFILALACVNFINLATARSAGRAREVGIRKVLGSFKSNLIAQFLVESVFVSLLSLLLAIIAISLLLSWFNDFTGKELTLGMLMRLDVIVIMAVVVLAAGFFAGSYPALFLSSFQPVKVLKGKLTQGAKSGWLRSGLVVFQFSVTILLIIGTMVVFQQLSYIQNKNLGYDKEHQLLLYDAWLLQDQVHTFKDAMLSESDYVKATVSSFLPVPSSSTMNAIWPQGESNSQSTTPIRHFYVDHDYIDTYDLEVVKGRAFSSEFATDSSGMLLNEAAVKHFQLDEPLGARFETYESVEPPVIKTLNVIGVIKDFHFESLHTEIQPMVFMLGDANGVITFKVSSDDVAATVAKLEKKWEEFLPGNPFNYSFLDERFDEMYRAEQRFGEIFGVFSLLAIIIGCLGLLGLAAFTAEQRTKEIGIRKVLGASVSTIVMMLSKEFVKLVGISFLIAAPIGYWIMNNWLENFAYRMGIAPDTFIYAGILALTVAILTVSYHAVRSALMNPVKSIKYE